jgi:integrase/recombinase XerD
MEIVTLKPLFHKGKECIAIYSVQSRLLSGATLNHYFQKEAGAKWSRTNKCWYVPCSEKHYELLAKSLSGKALLQVDELKKYFLERKKQGTAKVKQVSLPVIKQAVQKTGVQYIKQPAAISKENKEALEKFTQQLVLKSYSPSTIKTYTNEFTQLLQLIKDKPANEFNVQRIKDYLQYCH